MVKRIFLIFGKITVFWYLKILPKYYSEEELQGSYESLMQKKMMEKYILHWNSKAFGENIEQPVLIFCFINVSLKWTWNIKLQ